MITPIKTMTISQIIERRDDLLVSANDIKELAKSEKMNVLDEVINMVESIPCSNISKFVVIAKLEQMERWYKE